MAEGCSYERKDYLLYRLPPGYHADDIEVFHLVHSLLFSELDLQISTSPPTTRDYADYYDTVVSNDYEYDEADQYVYLSTDNKRATLFHDYICMAQLAITYALHRRALAELRPILRLKKEDTKLLLTHLLPVIWELYKTNLATDNGRDIVNSKEYVKKLALLPVKDKEQVASVVMYTSRGCEYLGLYYIINGEFVVYNVFRIGASRKQTLEDWQDVRIRLVVYPSIGRMQTFHDEITDLFASDVVISK